MKNNYEREIIGLNFVWKFIAVMLFGLALLLVKSTNVQAFITEPDERGTIWEYEVNDVTGFAENIRIYYDESSETLYLGENVSVLEVPFDINGHTVVSVGNGETNILHDDIYWIEYSGDSNFIKKSNIHTIILPNSVQKINPYAFSKLAGLTNVNLLSQDYIMDNLNHISLVEIGDYAFGNCPVLGMEARSKLVIPYSVEKIGIGAFTLNLNRKVYKNDPTGNEDYSGNGPKQHMTARWWAVAPAYKYLEIQGGERELTIGDLAFENCKISEVEIPARVTSIGKGAFLGSRLNNIIFSDETISLSIGEYAFSKTKLTNITIPSYVTTIKEGIFSESRDLASVTLPDNIDSIPNKAFYKCPNISNIIQNSITSIGDEAFKLSSIDTSLYTSVVNKVTTIGKEAFSGCENLTGGIEILNKVTSLGEGVFSNCENITGVTISSTNINSIPKDTFLDCIQLNNFQKTNNITVIGENAFKNCTSLDGTNFANAVQKVTLIGNYAFAGCTGIIGSLDLSDTIVTIGDYAFLDCNGITSLVVPKSVEKIASYAFKNCVNIENLVFNEGLKRIESYAFQDGLKNQDILKFPSTLTSIGSNAFDSSVLVLKDAYFNTVKDSGPYLNYRWYGRKEPIIHYLDVANKVEIINTLSGVTVEEVQNEDEGIDMNWEYNQSSISKPYETYSFTYNSPGTYRANYALSRNYTGYIPINLEEYSGTFRFGFRAMASGTSRNGAKISLDKNVLSFSDFTSDDIVYNLNATSPGKNYSVELEGGKTYYFHFACRIGNNGGYFTITDFKLEKAAGDENNKQYKLQMTDEANSKYPNLSVKVLSQGEFLESDLVDETSSVYDAATKTITFNNLNRDKKIIVQRITNGTDLVVREFISDINSKPLADIREPEVNPTQFGYEYLHTKYPVFVNNEDKIRFKIRVYNEGKTIVGKVNELTQYLPDGICFDENDQTNIDYGWTALADGKTLKTTYLADKDIPVCTDANVNFVELELVCKVNSYEIDYNKSNVTPRRATIVEITNGNDLTSAHGSLEINSEFDFAGYKSSESYSSSMDTYTKGTETDDDFECVEIKLLKKINYELKIEKEDIVNNTKLNDISVNLYNENNELIMENVKTTDGTLSFGEMATFGEGTDVYYVEETDTQIGYERTIDGKVEVKVIKTINNDGSVTIDVETDLEEKIEDERGIKYIPIYTKEQLAKIGSDEEITINGVTYKFEKEQNYMLQNDIDLAENNWVPIEYMKGTFDGNNHKIKNMKIVAETYDVSKEIALFAIYSGKIKNLQLEGVNINVISISNSAPSLPSLNSETYNETCVGGFIGLAESVTIENCSITGNIYTNVDNVGGFIGHSKEANIVIFESCTNEANVTGTKNVAGLIGCSKSALNINYCANSGNIETIVTNKNIWNCFNGYNAGGLVGYAEPTDYTVSNLNINVEEDETYKEKPKVITLKLKNKKVNDVYKLKLSNVESTKLKYLEGAEFEVYNPIKDETFNIKIQDGKMDIADIDFLESNAVYYLKQVKDPDGGTDCIIKDYIELTANKAWDSKHDRYVFVLEGKFKNTIDYEVNTPALAQALQGNGINLANVANGGNTQVATLSNTMTMQENIKWKVNKVNIVNSKNTGNVKAGADAAAGLIAAGITNLKISNCSNSGIISDNSENNGNAHIAGIAGYILGQDKYSEIEISNTVNMGNINNSKTSNYVECAGILAITNENLKIKNCSNFGMINTNGICSGIVAMPFGNNIEIIGSNNSGKLTGNYVGGIVGQSRIANGSNQTLTNSLLKNLKIKQCSNTGDIYGFYKVAGIVAYALNQNVDVSYCKSENYSAQIDSESINMYNATFSGIIGRVNSEYIDVNYCSVNNVYFKSEYSGQYHIGGIFGGICNNEENSKHVYNVNIANCEVKNLNVDAHASGIGGIVGFIKNSMDDVNIYGCCVDDMQINNSSNNDFAHNAGILGSCMYVSKLQIQDCAVNRYMVNNKINDRKGSDSTSAGIMGYGENSSTKINGCTVTNSNIQNNTLNDNNCAMGGIIAISEWGTLNIDNCDIIDTSVAGTAGDVGGIVGTSSGTTEISNCNVRGNSKIAFTIEKADCSQNCVGGIIAWSYNNVSIKDSNVLGTEDERITISGKSTSAVAGIIGCSLGNVEIKNSTVNYADIMHDFYYGTYATGGIIGWVNSGGEIVDCNVYNSSVSDNIIGTDGGSFSTGGIIGGSTSRIIINNCNVYKTQINDDIKAQNFRGKAVGGIAGYIPGEIINTTIEESEINSIARSTGGIVGSIYGDISNSNVISVNINGGKSIDELMTIGGIAAVVNSGKMSNNIVDNLKITSETNANIGGLIGVNKAKTQIENCKVLNNTVLENKKIYVNGKIYVDSEKIKSFMMGGMVALSKNTIEFINPQISDIQLKIAEGEETANHMGGLVGYADSVKVSTTNGTTAPIVNNLTMQNASIDGEVGGIVGVINENSTNDSEIKNINIQNVTANGKRCIGGIIGCGKAIIRDIVLANLNLISTKENSIVGGVAGILIPNSTINNVTVTAERNDQNPYTISSPNVAGGIVGISDIDVKNCTVENMKIKTTGNKVPVINDESDKETILNAALRALEVDIIASEIVGVLSSEDLSISNCTATNCVVE